jgi:putative MATE family efflux protein
MNSESTVNVAMLTGDPKSAVRKIAGPMMIAMILMTVYNLVDGIWVAGLGSDALAAIGFIFPVFFVLMGLGNGLGAGVGSAISRYIGANDKAGADSAGMQGLVITLILTLFLTIPLFLWGNQIFLMMGAGPAASLATEYGAIVFGFGILFTFMGVGSAMLRSEGNAKRAMYAMLVSSVINIVLDPILIYWAGWGIAGAAWATVISAFIVCLMLVYWYGIKRDTYVSLPWKTYTPDWRKIKEILGVGIPATFEFLLMSVLTIFINTILVVVGGIDAVAVYSAGWRVVQMAIIPMVAISTAVVAVGGAAYGAKQYDNLKVVHSYAIRIGVGIGLLLSIFTYLAAPWITLLFTYSPESAALAPEIIVFLQIMIFFYPFIPLGMMSSTLFQCVGKGTTSLIITVIRTVVFIALFAWLFGIAFSWGTNGVWWGIVAGDIVGGLIAYFWAHWYVRGLLSTQRKSASKKNST